MWHLHIQCCIFAFGNYEEHLFPRIHIYFFPLEKPKCSTCNTVLYLKYIKKCEMWRYEEDTSQKRTELEAMRGNKVATIKSLKEQKQRSVSQDFIS